MPSENVLVTGASSGIGLELARRFAESGSNLILVSRSEGRLHQLAQAFHTEYGIEARALAKDLASPTAPQEIFDVLQTEDVPVHVLVNLAGCMDRGSFTELSLEHQMNMVQVNVVALTYLSRLFLPEMLRRGRGGILNVASAATFQPGQDRSVYHATKAYVLSLTEGLAEELRGTGVTATCLAPGPMESDVRQKADLGETRLTRVGLMGVGRVAGAGYVGFRKGRAVVVPGVLNKTAAFAVRLAPRRATRRIIHYLHAWR